jgi:hypothetical protein
MMKPIRSIKRPRIREHGVAAIEMAFILPILLVLLTYPILFGRVYLHYTAAQKAAQDAARYLSMVPAAEMRTKKLAKAAAAVALEIAEREIAELAPGSEFDPPQVTCDDLLCGSSLGRVPGTVRVYINFGVVDPIFGIETPRYGYQITADVKLRYVGT